MSNKLETAYVELENNYNSKSNLPNWFTILLKTHLSKNITLQDWNTVQQYLKNIVSDSKSLKEFLDSLYNKFDYEKIPFSIPLRNIRGTFTVSDAMESNEPVTKFQAIINKGNIPDNTDLNKITEQGVYGWVAGSYNQNDSMWMYNAPVQDGFGNLIVTASDNYVCQQLVLETGIIYIRTGWRASAGQQVDSWKDWVKVNFKLDLNLENGEGLYSLQLVNANNSVIGIHSVSLGHKNNISSNYSFATGRNNNITGWTSYAEGFANEASGSYAHAQGWNTKALHECAHTAGMGTQSSRDYQTVIGIANVDNEKALLIVGNGTVPTFNNIQRSNAFEVLDDGRVKASGTPTEDNDLTTKKYVDALIKTLSSVEFKVVTELPTTNISTTTIYLKPLDDEYEEYIYIENKWELLGTTKVDLNNYQPKLTPGEGIEIDENNVISSKNGNLENGIGEGSIQAIGDRGTEGSSSDTAIYEDENGNEVFNYNSDFNTNAKTEFKTATGLEFVDPVPYGAIGRYAQAIGGKSSAQGKRSRTEGTTTIAYGDYSHAEGNTTFAIGGSSHAEGLATIAVGEGSHTEGYKTIARGDYSEAKGRETVADGEASSAEGYKTLAKGKYSHAEGYYSQANADNSFATNQNTKANAKNSSAFGLSTTADAPEQLTAGRYNQKNTDALFVVGNGKSNTDRKNALEVLEDGRIKSNGIPTEDNDLVPKSYVDKIAGSGSGGGSSQLKLVATGNFSEHGLFTSPNMLEDNKFYLLKIANTIIDEGVSIIVSSITSAQPVYFGFGSQPEEYVCSCSNVPTSNILQINIDKPDFSGVYDPHLTDTTVYVYELPFTL